MQMRPSRVLKKLRNDEIATCTKINLSDPRATEIAAICGFNCLWLDMEHVPTDWQTVDMGYQFISVGADVVGLWMYYKDIISKIRNLDNKSSDGIYKGK